MYFLCIRGDRLNGINYDELYRIMGAIYEANLPIVFKGGLITRLIVNSDSFRQTTDIDGSWLDDEYSDEVIKKEIQKALQKVDKEYRVAIDRSLNPQKGMSARIRIEKVGQTVAKLDLDHNVGNTKGIYTVDDFSFLGVEAIDIIADKYFSISSDTIRRRTKDLLDFYVLQDAVKIDKSELLTNLKSRGRKLGTFSVFNSEKEDLRVGYVNLKNVSNKPDFEDVYLYIEKFIEQ